MSPRRPGAAACGFDVIVLGDEVLVTAIGGIDLSAEAAFRRCLADAVRPGKPVLLDLTAVTFMDGRGYRAIRAAASARDGPRPLVTVITGSGLVASVLQAFAGACVRVRMS